MMKKVLYIFGLLAAFASCTRIENLGADERIGFDTYAARTTKAGDSYIGGNGNSTTNIPADSKFGVFAYFHEGDAGTSTTGTWNNANVNSNYSNMLLNEPVTRVQQGNTYDYTYSNSRYWPKNVWDRISFFAYYPYAAKAFIVDENAQNDGTGITLQDPEDDHYGYSHNPVGFPKFKFVVNTDASKQVDFMISDMCLNQSKKASPAVLTGNGDVQFTFHHMLSQVRIKTVDFVVENNDVTVELESFRFIGVPVSGIVTPSIKAADLDANGLPVNANGLAHMKFAWSGFNSSNSSFTASIYDENGTDAEKKAAIMLMIPHTFSEDPDKDIIEVTFKVKRAANAAGEHYEYTGHLTTTLGSGGLEGWEPNKIYNYTISVSLKAIYVTAQIEDWPEASTDVNTIKVNLNT